MDDDWMPTAWVPWSPDLGYTAGRAGMKWLLQQRSGPRVAWTTQKVSSAHVYDPLPPSVRNVTDRSHSAVEQDCALLIAWPTIEGMARALRSTIPSAVCVVAGPSRIEQRAAYGWALERGAVNLATGKIDQDPRTVRMVDLMEGVAEQSYKGFHDRKGTSRRMLDSYLQDLRQEPTFEPGFLLGYLIAHGVSESAVVDVEKVTSGRR